ncbi:toll/interleukin-1 receptor domain-containing protein [Nonlabens sp. YIK11]|uniref:toll/interleukin-1 receptor domain-containing protein n=1 Tax=Nonlabens sp. YIK11 TaxID=1453349 RepID=UPI0006DCC949|nr:toll/interleukin-1 receptor domain-containing protein [Nonlabens sp. YIK11]
MATLKDYFELDNKTLSLSKIFTVTVDYKSSFQIVGRIHLDFEANAFYISFYIEETDLVNCPALVALKNLEEIKKLKDEVIVQGGTSGETKMKSEDMFFTGRIFIYDENERSRIYDAEVLKQSQENGHYVQIRRTEYAEGKTVFDHPLAFISHDSRDKENIAKPIVNLLIRQACTVWFDEYSLQVGDSLRESIEKGIKEAKKCILIITPNFLNNSGWTKAEFNSVFTKDILKNDRSILPIWYNVSKEEVYEYSPILLDTVALIWPKDDDVDFEEKKKIIVNKLRTAIIS